MRAGAFGLTLLADPLNARVIDVLADGPRDLPDLREAVGTPPQTTLRSHIRRLAELGLLDRTVRPGFTKAVKHALTPAGRDLVVVVRALSRWLAESPEGAIALGSPTAARSIKALADGWGSTVLRALAARPLSLTELDHLIIGVNYPALERRLTAMRQAGQVAPVRGVGGPTRYRVTRWVRNAVAPILAVIGWESGRDLSLAPPLDRIDVEGIFLLAAPLVKMPSRLEGTCRLAIELTDGERAEPAGVVLCIEDGRPKACRSDRRLTAPSSASGSLVAWLDVLQLGRIGGIQQNGDERMTAALVGGLHEAFCRRFEMNSQA